jgi:L-ascorbate metabolism protein UlaG (beta-lactamase superfamily)
MKLDGIKLTWLGHATFKIDTPGGQTLLIDPWVMGNPKCPDREKDLTKVDVMLCTHGHGDHIGDAVEIAKKLNPKIVAIPELLTWLKSKGAKQILPMNKGGTQTVGDIKVTMVDARHSSGIQDGDATVYGGEPCVFGDMQIIRDIYSPDIALLPIGDHYTMGPREAAYACNLLKPKTVIPMHFGTFPQLTGTPAELKKLAPHVDVMEMKPGQTIT